jgi:hypothetical protein
VTPDLGKGDPDRPSADKPTQDVEWVGIEIAAQERVPSACFATVETFGKGLLTFTDHAWPPHGAARAGRHDGGDPTRRQSAAAQVPMPQKEYYGT